MLKPLADRVVVKVSSSIDKTKGGIFLPDTAQDRSQEGEVIAVGPGLKLDNGIVVLPEVQVGDLVIFAQYGGIEVKVSGDEYLILQESDILAIKK